MAHCPHCPRFGLCYHLRTEGGPGSDFDVETVFGRLCRLPATRRFSCLRPSEPGDFRNRKRSRRDRGRGAPLGRADVGGYARRCHDPVGRRDFRSAQGHPVGAGPAEIGDPAGDGGGGRCQGQLGPGADLQAAVQGRQAGQAAQGKGRGRLPDTGTAAPPRRAGGFLRQVLRPPVVLPDRAGAAFAGSTTTRMRAATSPRSSAAPRPRRTSRSARSAR